MRFRKLRINHPSPNEPENAHFEFCEDGTYDFYMDDKCVQSTFNWRIGEYNEYPMLEYDPHKDGSWKPFWDGEGHIENGLELSISFAQRLLDWTTSLQLLGDENYVIEN